MENQELICLDTSVLIDFFRKKDKRNSFFFELSKNYNLFAVSVITEYEILTGSKNETDPFWMSFFEKVTVLPFDEAAMQTAVSIYKQLKKDNKLIEIPDILIGSSALVNQIKLATLNAKHFERIKGLELIFKKE
jgi:tRNA(fMet)-specific endonuclease VapC